MRSTRSLTHKPMHAALMALVLVAGWAVGAHAASSCVTCHTDATMLEDTVAQVEAKTSAKQSGAG